MKVLDRGHSYTVPNLESEGDQPLVFIKRSSRMVKHDIEYPGTNTQEVMRVLIDRTKYLHSVGPCEETGNAIDWLRLALYEYEVRAWRRKQQKLNRQADPKAETEKLNAHRDAYSDVPFSPSNIEDYPVSLRDGHIILPHQASYDHGDWKCLECLLPLEHSVHNLEEHEQVLHERGR